MIIRVIYRMLAAAGAVIGCKQLAEAEVPSCCQLLLIRMALRAGTARAEGLEGM